MDVTDFLHKLAIVPDIEIVISLLPEMLGLADQAARHALLQRLESIGEQAALGFADRQVNMLRHDYIPVDTKPEAAPHTLQGEFEDTTTSCVGWPIQALFWLEWAVHACTTCSPNTFSNGSKS